MRSKEEMLALNKKEIFEGFLCGAFDSNGERYQVDKKGNRLYEHVFLSDRDNDFVHRVYTNSYHKDPWINGIYSYLNKYGFKHPVPTLYCYCSNGIITSRKLDFDLNIEKIKINEL